MAYSIVAQSWTDWVGTRTRFLKVCVLVVSAAIIAVSCQRDPIDFDSWWHLKMGQDFIEKGLSPYIDHYSSTYFEESIKNPPVIFQVGYYYLNQWAGERGGQVAFKLISYLSLLALFVLWLRQIRAPLLVYFLVLSTLVTVTQARMQVRPELLSYGLTVIAFILYWKALNDFSWRTLLPISALLLFWVNYHNPLFGYIVFFGLFVDVGIRYVRESASISRWIHWAGWGGFLVLLGFLRPEGQHFLMSWLEFSPGWRSEITEYRVPIDYLKFESTYIWLVTVVLTVTFCVIQKRWGFLLVALVFVWGGLSMARMIAPSMIVVLAISGVLLTEVFKNSIPLQRAQKWKLLVACLIVITSVTALTLGFVVAHRILNENSKRLANVPASLADYLESTSATGNIINVYHTGGYLLYRLGPRMKVFIDGRTDILYPFEHYLRYKQAMRSTDNFIQETNRYGIEWAVVDNTDQSRLLMNDTEFLLEFSDAQYSLYRKGEGRFPKLGELTAYPFCFSEFDSTTLQREVIDWVSIDPGLADLDALMGLVHGYIGATDKSTFLAGYDSRTLFNNPSKRLFASLALYSGLQDEALIELSKISNPLPGDLLIHALLMTSVGDREGAELHLVEALKDFSSWTVVYQRDLELLVVLLRDLDPEGTKQILANEVRLELEQVTQVPASLNRADEVKFNQLCRRSQFN